MKIPSLANLLARSFLIFIIVYLWASYYLHGFILPLLISVMIVIAVNYALGKLYARANHNKTTERKKLEHMRVVMLQLRFLSRAQTLSLLKAALSEKYKCAVNRNRLTIQTETKTTDIFTLLHKTPSESDIIECIKTSRNSIMILAESFTTPIIMLVKSLKADVQLLDAASVYNQILAPAEMYPKEIIETKKPAKISMRDFKNIVFSKDRTKGYVITAVVILLSSFIIRFSLYYIIFATLVFGLALASQFAPIQKKNLFE